MCIRDRVCGGLLANASDPTFHAIAESVDQRNVIGGGGQWFANTDLAYLKKLVRVANGSPLALTQYVASYLGHRNAGMAEWRALTDE